MQEEQMRRSAASARRLVRREPGAWHSGAVPERAERLRSLPGDWNLVNCLSSRHVRTTSGDAR